MDMQCFERMMLVEALQSHSQFFHVKLSFSDSVLLLISQSACCLYDHLSITN